MTEQLALLGAIATEPKDDTPRLVYADWLDEDGQQERARFIRLQIEAARTKNRRKQRKLDAEAGKLFSFACHLETWSEMKAWPTQSRFSGYSTSLVCRDSRGHYLKTRYTRGFIESVTCSFDEWCKGVHFDWDRTGGDEGGD